MLRIDRIRLIAKNECVYLYHERVFHVCVFIALGLAVFAGIFGWNQFCKDGEHRRWFQDQVRQQWLSQPDRHPHRVVHYGTFAFRPQSTLSYVDPGIDPFTGTSVYLEGHRQNTVNFSNASQSSATLLFGELNLAMILQQLIPLMVIFLSFSSVVREHELGTQKMLIATGVSARELIVGKFLGIGFIILLIAVIVLVVALTALLLQPEAISEAVEPSRVALLITIYGIYLFICLGVSVMISALCKRSHHALMGLVGLWIVFVILMPKSNVYLAETIFPTPAKAIFDAAIHERLSGIGDPHNPNDPTFQKLKEKIP